MKGRKTKLLNSNGLVRGRTRNSKMKHFPIQTYFITLKYHDKNINKAKYEDVFIFLGWREIALKTLEDLDILRLIQPSWSQTDRQWNLNVVFECKDGSSDTSIYVKSISEITLSDSLKPDSHHAIIIWQWNGAILNECRKHRESFQPLTQKVYCVGVWCKQYKGGQSPCDSVSPNLPSLLSPYPKTYCFFTPYDQE